MMFTHFITADKACRGVCTIHGLEGRATININRFDKWIPHIPEMSLHKLMLDLIVGQYCLRSRVPVDQPFSSINQPVFEEFEKRSPNGFGAHLVHSKARPLPVTGAAHRFQLLDNAGLIFVFPGLHTPNKLLALEVGTPFSFFREDSLLNDGLRSYTCVVSTRHPERVVILHPPESNQDVLQCIIQCVTKMQRCSNIRRRDHNGIGLLVLTVT